MITKTKIWTVIIVIVIIIIVAVSISANRSKSTIQNTGTATSTPVKIGVIAPLSGPAGAMGEEVANAVKLASSTSLELIFEDDQCDAKKAISAYEKLKLEGVHVFYVACSGSVIALAPRVKDDVNLIVTGYAGSSEIRKTGDEVIRFIPDAVSIANAMYNYLSLLKFPAGTTRPKIGLFYENQDYSKSAAITLQERLKEDLAMTDTYTAEDTTFITQITKLKAANIGVLFYIPTSDKAAQLVYKAMKTFDYKPHLIGDVNVCGYPPLPSTFGIPTTCFNSELSSTTPAYQKFLADYKSAYGVESNAPFYDAITYDVINIVDKFGRTNAQTDPVEFVLALKRHILAGVDGAMSRYDFTRDGEVIGDSSLKRVEK